jgi:hypothetical protein
MTGIPNLYISSHAVRQFRRRIAAMGEARARRFILTGILQATDVKRLPDGDTLRVRTRRPFPFEFRAFCVFDPGRCRTVVTTIVRGDSSVTRKRRRKAAMIKESDGADE